MDSVNKIKKIERKLKKLQHIVLKESGVPCDLKPTKNIVIANSGLVNGLSEEIIFKHFSQYGSLENVLLLPGKSCSFVSYHSVNSACHAFENCNGKLNIAQGNKPVYLLYTENLPKVKSNVTWDKLPPGLIILENFISIDEEIELLKLCDFEDNLNLMKNRQVKHYGYEFRYDINNVDKDKPLKESIPNQCNFLWDRLQKAYNMHFDPNQLTINQYSLGQGIPHHVDTHSAFEDPIISLSLQSSVVMEFKNDEQHICVLLPRRSLTVISGESRYDWTHGIIPRKFDVIRSNKNFTTLERGVRTSFTFRKILQGECNCSYKAKCDSYNKPVTESAIGHTTASQLEKLHVHEVYEHIAAHFSDTRHKPWPNVLEFVQSFVAGSILIDVGCGNGKYLGQIRNSFAVGCDQSHGLINICKDRGLEVFTSNCLSIPLRNNIADGVISIAVIHHLSNEDRRLQAIREITRVLNIGGRALIYVWAKDQCKDKEKSSYIKQDRKNRRSKETVAVDNIEKNQEVTVLDGISLPVHTNRTQFKHSDVLVPWKLKNQCQSDNTFLRYYHVFQEKELDNLCKKETNIEILKSYYDQGNCSNLKMFFYLLIFVNVIFVYGTANKCNEIEKLFKNSYDCLYNPDEYLNVPQMIARHGYPSETHVITTDDGYLLEVHRIPGSKSGKRGGQPVFLQHGLLGSSADWLMNGNNSLGYLLADQGYDVWLGNARGNTYSKGHISIPEEDPKFWNFSWHQMGIHDLPAALYHISNITEKPGDIIYIGHSMGTTMYFAMSSLNYQASKNVKLMIALAPVAYMTHIKSPIKYLAPFSSDFQWLAKYLGLNQFLPNNKILKFLAYDCELLEIDKNICENVIFVISGFDKAEFNQKMLSLIFKNDPAGTSTKTVIHYAQEIRSSGNFQQFDYGTQGNLIEYGTTTPPKYKVNNIKTPVYMMYGENDWLASYMDVQQLASNISILVGLYKVQLESFNHVDFLFGKDAEQLVYRPLMKVMLNYTQY